MLCAFTCARALAELHAVGIVHGDIASENILIDPHTLSAKLIDFDMASIEGTSM
jgi:serine/threonine protein kinase